MNVIKSVISGVAKDVENKSREFYEFVLPPIDLQMKDDRLTVTIDLPGFDKQDVRLHLDGSMLSITACKPKSEDEGIVYRQRPDIIDKKIRLPVRIRRGEESYESAKMSNGVLTIVIPVVKTGTGITIE